MAAYHHAAYPKTKTPPRPPFGMCWCSLFYGRPSLFDVDLWYVPPCVPRSAVRRVRGAAAAAAAGCAKVAMIETKK